ncbi:MAG: glycosyltransferase family 4 protein [Bacillota bacterium]
MKVAYFTDTYLPQINGVTNTLSRLVSFLDKKGIENIVFAPAERDYQYQTTVDTSFSVKFFLYPECRLSIPNPYRIGNLLSRFRPDLIHCITHFNMGLTGLKYSQNHRIPVVASYHTNFDQYLDFYNLPFMKNIFWEYTQWFHNQCLVNYAPSQDTIGVLQEKGIKNIELWSRGVDTELYNPGKRKEKLRQVWNASGKTVLLYVGRLSPEKNLQLLINCYRMLQTRLGDSIHLVITGDGPLLHSLRQESIPNATFTGYKTGEELAEIYASADVFVFPSSTETFGNVVLEAMSCGLPVIGFAAGGVKESICDGVNGLLCNCRDLDGFVQANEKLIQEQGYRNLLSIGARQYALTQSWHNIFTSLLNSYQEVLEKNQLWSRPA